MHEARVLVVDDSAAMRALFSDILDESKNVQVVGTAANADEARSLIAELRPNVLTLDVEMPGMSGIEFLEEISDENAGMIPLRLKEREAHWRDTLGAAALI